MDGHTQHYTPEGFDETRAGLTGSDWYKVRNKWWNPN
jgi:hypothetical protein